MIERVPNTSITRPITSSNLLIVNPITAVGDILMGGQNNLSLLVKNSNNSNFSFQCDKFCYTFIHLLLRQNNHSKVTTYINEYLKILILEI